MALHIPGRPCGRGTVNRDPDILQLHHEPIEQPRLLIHGMSRAEKSVDYRLASELLNL